MDLVLLEVSVGTVAAGGVLLYYIKKKKERLKSKILRTYTEGNHENMEG